ncbi:nitroreductase [Longispora sp. K20-0274]|uniref:Acg family FMN-binding oxidoreductase n=1 Tax=Longispora sp. K20-0274 TaxID=3088255 RepID=UPI00399B841A
MTMTTTNAALLRAIAAAQHAPSLLNTQPWMWEVDGDTAQLWARRDRQVTSIDPDGRLLTVSCGAALHHARTALAADGYACVTTRLPDADRPDLLAELTLTGLRPPEPADVLRYQSMLIRHTERRAFPAIEVPDPLLEQLRQAAEHGGAHLHILRPEEMIILAGAVDRAEAVELDDPAYRADLATWTHRPAHLRDGIDIPAPDPTARTVPIRTFDPDHPTPMGEKVGDQKARFAILFTDDDTPADWLTAGEALSDVLLTAVATDLAISPISDVIEVPVTRQRLRGMLSGLGWPMIALRIGVTERPASAPASTRRDVYQHQCTDG